MEIRSVCLIRHWFTLFKETGNMLKEKSADNLRVLGDSVELTGARAMSPKKSIALLLYV